MKKTLAILALPLAILAAVPIASAQSVNQNPDRASAPTTGKATKPNASSSSSNTPRSGEPSGKANPSVSTAPDTRDNTGNSQLPKQQ